LFIQFDYPEIFFVSMS